MSMDGMPIPLFEVKGRRVLVYQDEGDREHSKILKTPASSEYKYTQTVGTIVKIGDGFHPADPEPREEWASRCPFRVGDRVLWSKYEDTRIKMRVDPSWWEGKTEEVGDKDLNGNKTVETLPVLEVMRRLKREKLVEFVMLDVHQIWGIYTAPRKEIWED